MRLPALCRHYHAPWSGRFRTFYLRGSWWHELQVGPVVLQVKRRGVPVPRDFRAIHVWTTRYWR